MADGDCVDCGQTPVSDTEGEGVENPEASVPAPFSESEGEGVPDDQEAPEGDLDNVPSEA